MILQQSVLETLSLATLSLNFRYLSHPLPNCRAKSRAELLLSESKNEELSFPNVGWRLLFVVLGDGFSTSLQWGI